MTRTISDAMIRIDPILSEGWWMELRSPFIIGGDCWRCGLTQAGATGWNGSPDIEAAGETATEAIENVCDMWERRNDPTALAEYPTVKEVTMRVEINGTKVILRPVGEGE